MPSTIPGRPLQAEEERKTIYEALDIHITTFQTYCTINVRRGGVGKGGEGLWRTKGWKIEDDLGHSVMSRRPVT